MQALGIEGLLPSALIVDGEVHRFRPDHAGSKTGWYQLWEISTSNGLMIVGRVGDWKLGINEKVSQRGVRALPQAERDEIKRRMEEAKAQQQALAERRADNAAKRAARTWAKLSSTGTSDYLTRKRVKGYGAKYSSRGSLVLCLRDFKGFVHGLQAIKPDGEKRFWPPGVAKKKRFHLIGDLNPATAVVVVCEGFATGASIHEATGIPVLVAFDAGNLVEVCAQLRWFFPKTRVVVAADDDYATEGNPGLSKGDTAAKRCKGAVAFPVFKDRPENTKWTDFNDLHLAEGLEAVKQIIDQAVNQPEPVPDLPDASGEAESWMARMSRTDTGKPRGDIFNTQLVLRNDSEWAGVLGYCDFSYRVMKRRSPPFAGSPLGEWTDSDTDRLRIWLTEKYGFTPKSADADGAVVVAAESARFHPVREYLLGLKWDGKPRLRSWLSLYLGVDQKPYTEAVGIKWMVAAVARVMDSPVKADCVLILEGLQGLGKSTALRILGGEWFSDTHFALGEKDGYQQMQGVWICELAELDSFNKAESTRAKQFFASLEDRYRPSYGRRAVDFARQCVFAGSTNQDTYLRDATGNRRYWPVMAQKLDADALYRDRDQLWAEALHEYQAGTVWHPLDNELHLFEREQDARFDEDVWSELVEKWLMAQVSREVMMSDVMLGALKMDPGHMRKPEQMRVGQIMLRLGWRKKRGTNAGSGKRETGYEAPSGWKKQIDEVVGEDIAGF